MKSFKPIPLRPTIGLLDTLSSPEEIGFGNWRVVKNATARTTRSRQRSGGWRRLFADDEVYNNQDLHDQLTDIQFFYDSYSMEVNIGGGFSGYEYPYFAPASIIPGYSTFPNLSGPYCAYIGNYPSGLLGDCPIFYPFVGWPYTAKPGYVNTTYLLAHWKMDAITGGGLIEDAHGTYDFTAFGCSIEAGLLGGAVRMDLADSDYLVASYTALQTGDISFGITGWLKPISITGSEQSVIGRWNTAGSREYRLVITAGGALRFDVSNNGSTVTSVTHGTTLTAGQWVFFAVWHDPTGNTINIKINNLAKASAAHTTGVYVGAALYLAIGYDEGSASTPLNAVMDEVSFWKNGFPTEVELLNLYNSGTPTSYPFDFRDICNTGSPYYYLYSYLYSACPVDVPAQIADGYPYGYGFPVYDPPQVYTYDYCGNYVHVMPGCRESVSMVTDITTSAGRKLIAATKSRVYELNQSTGNWRILADGLGGSVYSSAQCGCNDIRGVSSVMGGYLLFTNNFDYPMSYYVGDPNTGCDLFAMHPIADLVALGVTRAGGVISWNGFAIFFDITEAGEELGSTVIWSDFEQPESFIESDTSFAGRSTIGAGNKILAAAPMGNWLLLYTDTSIVRVTLVGGDDVFNFETIYTGDDALMYKHSLVNAGKLHIYAGKSDLFVMTQFDVAPVNVSWITKAAGIMFNGIVEDDATYEAINESRCEQVVGGWNEITKEAWFSWPTGDNSCPNLTLRLNTKYNAADIIDHGFTAFHTFRRDTRPTVGQWIENLGICPRGSVVAEGVKDGQPCLLEPAVQNPPTCIRNAAEDPSLPADPDSLCTALAGKTVDDYCQQCPNDSVFVMASAQDFALKQAEDDYYYREMLATPAVYNTETCSGEFYANIGYDTVMQMGLEAFRSDDEKMIKRVTIEAVPLAQSVPSDLECEVGYGSQPNCITWATSATEAFKCSTAKTNEQHAAQNTRQDGRFDFSFWRRGLYLSARFRIGGVGGGGTFGALHLEVKNWGQAQVP